MKIQILVLFFLLSASAIVAQDNTMASDDAKTDEMPRLDVAKRKRQIAVYGGLNVLDIDGVSNTAYMLGINITSFNSKMPRTLAIVVDMSLSKLNKGIFEKEEPWVRGAVKPWMFTKELGVRYVPVSKKAQLSFGGGLSMTSMFETGILDPIFHARSDYGLYSNSRFNLPLSSTKGSLFADLSARYLFRDSYTSIQLKLGYAF